MPKVVSFVGKSNTGKTTLIEKVICKLTSKGYRVATAKNTSHEVIFDKPGTDSWRHIQAGSEATVLNTPGSLMLIEKYKSGTNIDSILRLFGEDYDIIILEGFKNSNVPKIEVHRKEMGTPLTGLKNLIALATDERLNLKITQFDLNNDVDKIAEFLEIAFIKKDDNNISLYANETNVALKKLPKKIGEKVTALINMLQAIEKIDSFAMFLRKKKAEGDFK